MADFSERAASLNTQMRFKRYKAALPIAYSLRLDLQLANPTPKHLESLKAVEEVIEMLEKTKVSRWTRLLNWVARSLRDSMDPDEAPAPASAAAPPATTDESPETAKAANDEE